jgi:hypothetical protein
VASGEGTGDGVGDCGTSGDGCVSVGAVSTGETPPGVNDVFLDLKYHQPNKAMTIKTTKTITIVVIFLFFSIFIFNLIIYLIKKINFDLNDTF